MAPPPDPELDTLRHEVDRIDGAVIELLAERMQVVAAIAAAKQRDGAVGLAIRPGREAVILRRLVARAAGRLPAGTLVRMWRELLAATVRAQSPLTIVAFVPPDEPGLWDLARDHFGSSTPVRRVESAARALSLAADDPARLAVLPMPDERHAWWQGLLDGGGRPLRVIARLPFAAAGRAGSGLVVGLIEPEPSGEDACLVAIETGAGISRARLAELVGSTCPAARCLATARGEEGAMHLIELDGGPALDEVRLAAALAPAREHVLRVAWLGGYARPLAGDA